MTTPTQDMEIHSYREGYDFPWVTDLEARDRHRIWIRYSDGVEGVVDLSHCVNKPLFADWQTEGIFESVRIGDFGEIWWTDKASLCADSIYLELTGKSFDEVSTGLVPGPSPLVPRP